MQCITAARDLLRAAETYVWGYIPSINDPV